jgi:hypothetical protein
MNAEKIATSVNNIFFIVYLLFVFLKILVPTVALLKPSSNNVAGEIGARSPLKRVFSYGLSPSVTPPMGFRGGMGGVCAKTTLVQKNVQISIKNFLKDILCICFFEN